MTLFRRVRRAYCDREWLALAGILVLGALVRVLATPWGSTPGNDAAQYLGLADDLLKYGELRETLSREAEGHYLPIAFSSLTALVAWVTGLKTLAAAQTVSILSGLGGIWLLFHLALRVTGSLGTSIFCGLALALNPSHVEYSIQPLTEALWMLLALGVFCCLYSLGTLKENLSDRWRLWGLSGVLMGAAFLTRAASLSLLVTVPAMILILRFNSGIPLLRTIKGALLATGIAMTVVFWNAYRLEERNGYFSLSPQIAGNVAVGDAIRLGRLDAFAVGEDGKRVRLFAEPLQEGSAVAAWIKAPRIRIAQFFRDLSSNFRFAVQASLGPLTHLPASLALLLGLMLFRGLGGFTSFRLPLLWPSALFALVHLSSYSIFMSWRRYAEQAVPWMILAFAPLALTTLRFGFFQLRASIERVLQGVRNDRVPGKSPSPSWSDIGWALSVISAIIIPLANLVIQMSSGIYGSGNGTDIVHQIAANIRADCHDSCTPRIALPSMAPAYLAGGTAILLPYGEDRPRALLQYFVNNRVTHVYSPTSLSLGDFAFEVPAIKIMSLLVNAGFPGLELGGPKKGRYFRLHLDRFPEFLSASQSGLKTMKCLEFNHSEVPLDSDDVCPPATFDKACILRNQPNSKARRLLRYRVVDTGKETMDPNRLNETSEAVCWRTNPD